MNKIQKTVLNRRSPQYYIGGESYMDNTVKSNTSLYTYNEQEVIVNSYFDHGFSLKEIIKQYLVEQYKNQTIDSSQFDEYNSCSDITVVVSDKEVQ